MDSYDGGAIFDDFLSNGLSPGQGYFETLYRTHFDNQRID